MIASSEDSTNNAASSSRWSAARRLGTRRVFGPFAPRAARTAWLIWKAPGRPLPIEYRLRRRRTRQPGETPWVRFTAGASQSRRESAWLRGHGFGGCRARLQGSGREFDGIEEGELDRGHLAARRRQAVRSSAVSFGRRCSYHLASASPIGVEAGPLTNGQISSARRLQLAVALRLPSTA
jgi:hypothetical protein